MCVCVCVPVFVCMCVFLCACMCVYVVVCVKVCLVSELETYLCVQLNVDARARVLYERDHQFQHKLHPWTLK